MTKTTCDKILDIIAREAERAYRRGFQQGRVIGPSLSDEAVWKWRFERSLAKAPRPETGKPIPFFPTPRDRLECENRNIEKDVATILAKG